MKNLSDTITNNIKKHLIQPWPYASSIGDEYRDIVTNGDGIYIEDKNGNKLIDGPAGMWCSNIGHRNEEIANYYPNIYDIVISPEKFGKKDVCYVSDAGYGWKIISNISNNDRESNITDHSIENINKLIELILQNKNCFIISTHPHRWRRYSFTVYIIKALFFILRFIVRKLTKITFINKLISKFYYLAKKI